MIRKGLGNGAKNLNLMIRRKDAGLQLVRREAIFRNQILRVLDHLASSLLAAGAGFVVAISEEKI